MNNYGSYLLETFLMLVVVCGAAWAILFGARKLGFGRAKGPISMLGQLPLDARRSIFLVRVGGKVLVVGASEAGLTKLSEMEASELDDRSSAKGSTTEPTETSFKEVLARITSADTTKEDA